MANLSPGTLPEATPHFAALNTNVVTEAPPSVEMAEQVRTNPSIEQVAPDLYRTVSGQIEPQGVKDVRQLEGTVSKEIERVYANPLEAKQNWRQMALDGVGNGTIPPVSDPTALGILRDDIDPRSVDLDAINAGMGSYRMAHPESRERAQTADLSEGEQPTQSTPSEPGQAQQQTGSVKTRMENQMNDRLLQAPMEIGHLSI